MKVMGKFTCGLLIAVSIFYTALPLSLYAQEAETYFSEDSVSLFVDNISLSSRDAYTPGDTVFGTFSIYNTGTHTAASVRYRVELIELLDIDGATYPSESIHASPLSESLTVATDKPTNVSFSYKLPVSIPAGSLALAIQTYVGSNGTPAGYEYVPVLFTEQGQVLLERSAVLSVNETEIFDVLEGPTVKKEEAVALHVATINKSKSPISVQPVVRIYAGNSTNAEVLNTQTFPEKVLSTGTESLTTFSIPNATMEPGVYTVTAHLIGTDGADVIAPVEARIVVDGLKPKLAEITYSNLDLSEASHFDVTISYLDVPFNVRTNADGTAQDPRAALLFSEETQGASDSYESIKDAIVLENMSAFVRLRNAVTGEMLAEQEVEFIGDTETIATFEAVYNVNLLEVQVELKQNGEVIDTHSETVTVQTKQYANMWQEYWNTHTGIILLIGGLLILIVCLGIFMNIRKQRYVQSAVVRNNTIG